MSRRQYSLLAGIALLAVAVVFFITPALLDYDAFFPVMLALVSLLAALVFLVNGAARD